MTQQVTEVKHVPVSRTQADGWGLNDDALIMDMSRCREDLKATAEIRAFREDIKSAADKHLEIQHPHCMSAATRKRKLKIPPRKDPKAPRRNPEDEDEGEQAA